MARDSVLSRGEWLALAAAIAIAHLFYWRIVNYPSDFDARNYLDIAIDINRNGLFSKFYYSDIRTYAYPLLLAHLIRIADLAHVPVSALVFETQLALYLAAAYILRRQVANVWPGFARWAFIGVVLNVFALSYTPESLTESVSMSLIVLTAACWTAVIANPLSWRPLLAGSIVTGLAVMVRPANLFLLFAWIVAVAAAWIVCKPAPRTVVAMIVTMFAGVLLPMLPQYANNVRHYGQHTPLVAARLGHNQQIWGVGYIKYATALPPVPNPSIFYENPFSNAGPIDEEHPLRWYIEHPLAGALTVALHTFDVLDQDLLFTYSRDLDPWYRIPVGIANHGLVAAALVGIAMLSSSARRSRACALAAIAVIAYVVGHVALHATSAVEMRFGVPLLLVAGPAAIGAVRALAHAQAWTRWLALTAIAIYVIAALALSDWVRQQAPAIRAWQAAHPSPWMFRR